MSAGKVIEVSSKFKYDTSVVSIQHGTEIYDDDYFVVRYGEVDTVMVSLGSTVAEGQLIAKVGKQPGGTQLHLEMYSGFEDGQFLQEKSLPYKPWPLFFSPPKIYGVVRRRRAVFFL